MRHALSANLDRLILVILAAGTILLLRWSGDGVGMNAWRSTGDVVYGLVVWYGVGFATVLLAVAPWFALHSWLLRRAGHIDAPRTRRAFSIGAGAACAAAMLIVYAIFFHINSSYSEANLYTVMAGAVYGAIARIPSAATPATRTRDATTRPSA